MASSGRFSLPDWSRALGHPPLHGVIRLEPEDFVVEELLAFEPEGEGDHLWLQVRKRGANTAWVAQRIAECAGVAGEEVGYAGLKDRHAVTTQWMSLPVGRGPDPDWHGWSCPEFELLAAVRHRSRLRRGELAGNRFRIVVRELDGDCDLLEARVASASCGVPNYFGEQRFGRDGGNVAKAAAMFAGELKERDRHLRSLYLSAARSFLFNRVLARRIEVDCWDRAVAGDHLVLHGGDRHFIGRADDPKVIASVAEGRLHPTGPLWGAGPSPAKAQAAEHERGALAGCEALQQGIERTGMRQERRALRVMPSGLRLERMAGAVAFSFELPAGCFATAVLRELIDYDTAAVLD